MKVFKKVFAFAVALTAIAMASSAMAADAIYSDGSVSVENDFIGEAQTTVAVVDSRFGENDTYSVEDIYYVNQDTAANIGDLLNNGVELLVNNVNFVPATTEVRVGGNDKDTYETYYIQKLQDVTINTIAPDEDDAERRFGFDGTYQFNGGSISAIKFELESLGHDGALYESSATVATNNDALVEQLLGRIPSAYGEFTFGLEVANVPAGVTVTLTGVTVE